ncbi:zinc finger protein 611 isoform X1 [Ixodes scapularis]|uniref:zinc finger protein 611 isoform X1 n=2 Tax=Ixodes scapularis TaxID=6945 RepID=UPI001A9FF7AE|nr:zinc finger protein 611 isoform X1 [Ixodes scapularis]
MPVSLPRLRGSGKKKSRCICILRIQFSVGMLEMARWDDRDGTDLEECNDQPWTPIGELDGWQSGRQSGRRPQRKDGYRCRSGPYSSFYALEVGTHGRTAEKPLSCPVCQKTFGQNVRLKVHMRIHTGEKPYRCDVCQKAFAERTDLVRHKRVHTGEKPYQCVVCGKAFAVRCNLLSHERSHAGERSYKCEACEKMFTQKIYLKKHWKSTHM